MAKTKRKFRMEKDALGTKPVPSAALYGIQTVRASANFRISGVLPEPVFIMATAMVKKAAAEANIALRLLDRKRGAAIIQAASEIIEGKHWKEFIVDVYQAGAGTSHNMNANEVIANRASVMLGGKKGVYEIIHPNDHVNMAQSTNDVIPTAMRLSALTSSDRLIDALHGLKRALRKKARETDGIIKSGRTHLQDAVPIRLGSEFGSYASGIDGSITRISAARTALRNIGLGGTAVGTGLNTHPAYRRKALSALRRISGIRGLKPAPDSFEAISSMADFSAFSGALRDTALVLIKIANDIRLLSSGPRTGLAEITLPAVQPGSSIMPGKVNPVMAEMLNMVSFQVIGNDLAVTMAAQAGQLELNVMGPVINYNILQSIEILTNAVRAFTDRCVSGIKADRKRCADYFEKSAGLATILNRLIGYEKASEVARESVAAGKTVREAVLEKGILTKGEWKKLLSPLYVTGPSVIRKVKNKKGR
ncbi:MAG: aspartate ammonia-lyase [Deltaproteobacteria bacterium]|nr:aspartate ammonia-lyase [Deltaproteobacteria bacterium]